MIVLFMDGYSESVPDPELSGAKFREALMYGIAQIASKDFSVICAIGQKRIEYQS